MRTELVQALTRNHCTALNRLVNDALPQQTRDDVLVLASTYQGLLTEYLALQETIGNAIKNG